MENIWNYIILTMVIGYMLIISYQTNIIQKENSKKIDRLLNYFQVKKDYKEEEDELLNQYIIEKNNNKSIKRYRELTGCSLSEAVKYVNSRLKE